MLSLTVGESLSQGTTTYGMNFYVCVRARVCVRSCVRACACLRACVFACVRACESVCVCMCACVRYNDYCQSTGSI